MPKLTNQVTLDEVNSALLQRWLDRIAEASDEELPAITTAIAKLNASWKGNEQFQKPETAEERTERETKEMFKNLINGEEV